MSLMKTWESAARLENKFFTVVLADKCKALPDFFCFYGDT